MNSSTPWTRLIRHMRFHSPKIGFYRAARLAAALTYGELRDKILPRYVEKRRSRLDFDERFHVRTAERWFVADMTGVDEVARQEAIRYEPITLELVDQSLDAIPADFSLYTLVDIGAGKGKVLFIAASRPFKKLVGVEFDSQLSRIARDNITTYSNPDQKCHDIDIVNADARRYALPDGPVLLFFHFPFRAPLLQEVLEHYGSKLRNCYLIWITLDEPEANVLLGRTELERVVTADEYSIFRGKDIEPA